MAAPAYLDLPGSADNATQVPCAFDFTSGLATSSAGEIPLAVTRAGVATRVNGQGFIEVVPANTLRLDYDPVTLACKGALIEESRTNLLDNSDVEADLLGWSEGSGNANGNAISRDNQHAISGTWAVKYHAGGVQGGGPFWYTRSGSRVGATPGLAYTSSVWIYAPAGAVGKQFDLAFEWYNGVGTFLSGNIGPTFALVAGWQRKEFTATAPASTATLIATCYESGGPQGSYDVWFDVPQVEQGSFATSVIPTTVATVTRNADVPTVSSLGSWYSASEGTVFAEASVPAIPVNAYGPVVELSDGTSNEYPVDLALVGNIAAAPFVGRLTAADGGVVQADITTGTLLVANTVYRLAAVYKVNDWALYRDGTQLGTDASGTLGTATRLDLGYRPSGGNCLNGHLRKFAYIPKRLLNASLQTLSLNGLVLKQYTQAVTRARPRFSAPNIPDDTPAGLRQFLVHLKELVEVRNAELGSPLDSNPTYRDLIDTGLIKVSDNVPLLAAGREFTLDTKTWLTSNIPDWVTDNTDPPTPTGLIIVANTATITLKWDAPSFANYKQTLIYRATSNNLSNAAVIGSNTGNTYVDDLPAAGTAYYYWIRHESKSELLSNFNSTNGTTVGNTPSAPVVGYAFAGENLVLSWTTPTSNLAIQYFEVSHGATPGANPVGVTQANTLRVRVDYGSTRQYWVRAIDINFGVGTAGTTTVTVNSPAAPSLSQTLTGGSLVLSLTAGSPGSLPISYYDLRYGASWAAGTLMGVSPSTRYELNVNWTGARTFYAVAVDTAGNQSSSGSVTFTPTLPAATTLTAQVIDNNVLLRWLSTQGSLPIDHFNVYRDATLIGTDAALFAAVFESVAGTYVYKVEPVDTAGNVGSVSTTTAVVAQPPDFVLFSSLNSTFSGTKTTCFKDVDTGQLIANVDATETWQSHFTTRSWNTPQDQITAGYSRYLVGKTTGSYLEKVDYAATIPSTKVTMTPTTAFSQGTVTQTPTLATSPDDSTYTTYAGVSSVFATAFRYVKYKIDFAAAHDGTGLAADTSNLIGINPLTYTLDVKLKTKEGVKTANSGDSGGTSVDITGMFIDVSSIILTPLATAARHATYDFTDVPNPTSFKILLWNDTGARATGDVSWVVRGV